MGNTKMEAEIIFEPHIPTALKRALDFAGDDGFVASLPQLLYARANVSYDNIIWNTWFTSRTEETVTKTAQGNRVVVVVHGGGIFAKPERFERAYESRHAGFTAQFAGKITDKEASDILNGKLSDGTEIPVYGFDEFKRGIADLPMRYGIIMDFDMARKSERGYVTIESLWDEPNMICRAGGVEALAAYLNAAQSRHNTKIMGNWHPYNRIDPDVFQTRIVFLAGNKGGLGTEGYDDPLYGYDAEYAIGGDACIHNMARFIAVAPRDASTSVRDLSFEA